MLKSKTLRFFISNILVAWGSLLFLVPSVYALTVTDSQSLNVTAVVYGPPPTTPAIITSPENNTSVSVTPLVIHGTCGVTLTVKIYSNGDLIGTTNCESDGSFSVNVTLKLGRNELTALNFDFQDQQGPPSDTVVVIVTQVINHSPSAPAKRSGEPSASNSEPSVASPNTVTPYSNTPLLPSHLTITLAHTTWLLVTTITVLLWTLLVVFLKKRHHRMPPHEKPTKIIKPD